MKAVITYYSTTSGSLENAPLVTVSIRQKVAKNATAAAI